MTDYEGKRVAQLIKSGREILDALSLHGSSENCFTASCHLFSTNRDNKENYFKIIRSSRFKAIDCPNVTKIYLLILSLLERACIVTLNPLNLSRLFHWHCSTDLGPKKTLRA